MNLPKLSLIFNKKLTSEETAGIIGPDASNHSKTGWGKLRIGEIFENPRRFAKDIEPRRDVVPDPSRHPKASTIMGGPERITNRRIIMVERNVINRPTQSHKKFVKLLGSRRPTRELIVGHWVDAWRRTERI